MKWKLHMWCSRAAKLVKILLIVLVHLASSYSQKNIKTSSYTEKKFQYTILGNN